VTVDRTGRRVIVSHYSAPFLSIFDPVTLAPEQTTIQVGDRMTAVLADVNRDRVYVAREGPDEIAVVDLRMQTVIRRIPISGRVDSLAQPRQGSYLYGAAPEIGALVVVNVVRLREEDPLPCGSAPSYVYGAAPQLGALVVVNVVRLREEEPLPCGSAPSYVVTTD
jgi:hypothetical protein